MSRDCEVAKTSKRLIMLLAKAIFYIYGFLWSLRGKRAGSMEDVLRLFYIDFLRLGWSDVEVVRLSRDELVTRCRNPCPILNLSIRMGFDTKQSCRIVSEPVCRYVLKKLNPNLAFERNYDHIRPYKDSCEERVYWKGLNETVVKMSMPAPWL